ncbi:MAG: hypothetical protein ACREOO_00135 [bacterium]
MSRLLFSLALLWQVLAPPSTRAQVDPLQAVSFFPLQTGNQWQYQITFSHPPGPDPEYRTAAVVADTLMPNGRKYHVVKLPLQGTEYLRIDTTALVVYRYYTPIPGAHVCLDSERVYFYRLQVDAANVTAHKMLLLR